MAMQPRRWNALSIEGWCASYGLDASEVVLGDFGVRDNHDGTWTVTYKEFIERGPNGEPTKTEVKTILVDTPPPENPAWTALFAVGRED